MSPHCFVGVVASMFGRDLHVKHFAKSAEEALVVGKSPYAASSMFIGFADSAQEGDGFELTVPGGSDPR
jgi:hypothetical protein